MNRLVARLLRLLELLTIELALTALAFFAAFALFFYLTRVVFVEHSVLLDDAAFAAMDSLRAAVPALTRVARVVTFFASAPFLITVGVVVPALLAWRQHQRPALKVLLAILGATILNMLLKAHFHRLRPDSALFMEPGLSFPSGHAMIGVAFYGSLAGLLWRQHPVGAILLLVWSGLIGLTRIYFHVHYATDVLAGFAAGLTWLILLRTALRWWWRERRIIERET